MKLKPHYLTKIFAAVVDILYFVASSIHGVMLYPMNTNNMLITKFTATDRKAATVLTLLVTAFVIVALTQDYLRSYLKNSAFYFSESFMFSSFWWLLAPLLFAQYFTVKHKSKKSLEFKVALVVVPVVLHLFVFPTLVWALSTVFYYHTYSFQQTFRYTLSEQLYQLVLIYSIPVLTFQFFLKKTQGLTSGGETKNERISDRFISTILVSDGNRKHLIMVSDIFYFSANPPYISLHLDGKKYLQSDTLKSISIQLNAEQFVRVHKSTIVNIKMVESYTSRLNGDYDLTLRNSVQLRVSRNFAADFKKVFKKTHHLTTE